MLNPRRTFCQRDTCPTESTSCSLSSCSLLIHLNLRLPVLDATRPRLKTIMAGSRFSQAQRRIKHHIEDMLVSLKTGSTVTSRSLPSGTRPLLNDGQHPRVSPRSQKQESSFPPPKKNGCWVCGCLVATRSDKPNCFGCNLVCL